jgi:arylsulfatase A
MSIFLVVAGFTAISTAALAADAGRRPNIVLILADDLGWGDLPCYNPDSKITTPNLDMLASGGIRFTQAYCPVSVCSPTRYSLMTGRYPWRSWKKNGVLANWERHMIQDGQLTLPSMLRQAGYTTVGYGKWHLGARYKTLDGEKPVGLGKFKSKGTGSNIDLSAPIAGGPVDFGFDQWFGFICASEMLVFQGNHAATLLSHSLYEPPPIPGVEKLARTTVADLLHIITENSIAWMRDRAAKHNPAPFFFYYAPYVPHIPLAVGSEYQGRTKAGEYGDYVHQLDHEVGRLLQELDETGFAANTMVIFASDNGSQFNATGEGHHPNGGLRGVKGQIHEGGVRTPLIVRWPGHVPAGTVSSELVALTDMMATLAALNGQKLPENAANDSYNILPLLLGEKPAEPIRSEVLVQSAPGQHGLRQGKWKYIQATRKAGAELYDLEADPAEQRNLLDESPEVASKLQARLKYLLAGKRTAPSSSVEKAAEGQK